LCHVEVTFGYSGKCDISERMWLIDCCEQASKQQSPVNMAVNLHHRGQSHTLRGKGVGKFILICTLRLVKHRKGMEILEEQWHRQIF
jgi:hypothetical protein